MTDKEEKNGERRTHSDNNFSQVQKIMKDNNLPTFYSDGDEDENNETD